MSQQQLIGLSLALAVIAMPASADGFRVTGFHQGLVTVGRHSEPAIGTRGDAFDYAPNGPCTVAGEQRQCMWYGFEFDYAGGQEVNALACTVESSDAVVEVDPSKRANHAAERFNYTLQLDGANGHFINPQYTIWGANSEPFKQTTWCRYGDREVLRFTLTIRPPKSARPKSAGIAR